MLQLAAHHARAGLHLLGAGRAFTQFDERDIGLFLDLGTDELVATLERTWRTVDLGSSRHFSSLALPR